MSVEDLRRLAVEAMATAINQWGTGMGEDGYYRVYIEQHAEEMAHAALDALLDNLTDNAEAWEVGCGDEWDVHVVWQFIAALRSNSTE